MKNSFLVWGVTQTALVAFVILNATTTYAQSGSRANTGSGSRATTGSASRTTSGSASRVTTQSGTRATTQSSGSMTKKQAVSKVGYSGYCPVCILDMKKWVKGDPSIQATYDNTVYYFPNAETKQKFVARPEAYVPALGGDCTVCLAKMGKRVPGSLKFASLYQKRVFLFPEAKQKQMFDASPAEFANVDLAANGNCVVCTVKMNQEVPGKPEFTAVHKGMRYQFPSDKQKQMFTNSPAEFTGGADGAMNKTSALGLDGNCTVCLVMKQKWVKGSPDHAVQYDGKKYLFPDAGIKQTFVDSPEKFVPALNGDCILCFAKMGKRVSGNVKFASMYENRVFLFPSEKEKSMFDASPAEFANADLAANGNCIVCLAKMKKEVPGKTEFTAIHNGLRYLFPSDAERQMFMKSPADFVSAASGAMKTSQAQPQQDNYQTVSVQGRTSCAACSYGVHPIGAPDELGMAIVDATGKVFVVEESHTKWPALYKDRFDGKQVQVSGKILKEEGNFVWIKPTALSAL